MTTSRLQALRELMRRQGLHAYLVPSEDAHQSEYLAACDLRRAFISGFDGSAGTALVLENSALLWTDGRYYLQAAQQLDNNWQLMKGGHASTPSIEQWLSDNLGSGQKLGIDPQFINILSARRIGTALGSRRELVWTSDLVADVWHDQPAPPCNPVRVHTTWAGRQVDFKLAQVRTWLRNEQCDALVVSALDEVMWLLNIRGGDIEFNPVAMSYAIVTQDSAVLYIDEGKIDSDGRQHLAKYSISIKPYSAVYADLTTLRTQDKKIALDPSKSNVALYIHASGTGEQMKRQLPDTATAALLTSPITLAKAIKNSTELEGMRSAHLKDAVALIQYLAWLEKAVTSGGDYDEVTAANILDSYRKKQHGFVSLSFANISAVDGNGAIIHYTANAASAAKITGDSCYLIDSGGQYVDGTTDVTRTVHFGTPSSHLRTAFTHVLKGHIALDSAVFPVGTTGHDLDSFARAPLWKLGLDYRHGTGHGVGAFLNVHEGPQLISFRKSANETALQVGMTVTNEPGYYEDGKFGIRIENVMIVQSAETPFTFDHDFLAFEHITLVPIQKKLIDPSVMSPDEIKWLDTYHQKVWDRVSSWLPDQETTEWLRDACRPLDV